MKAFTPLLLHATTGWYRDGYCHTDSKDYGLHTVCATMTKEFLDYTKSKGNDLSSPNAHFPGLKPGDSWCLCAARWAKALRAGVAPKVKLEATNEASLKYGVKIQSLQEHATEKKDIESMDYAVAYENCNSDNSLCEK